MFLGSEKRYPVELQERARLHFPYTSSTYYHVESVLQKRLKRQDHPLLIVSISFYNRPNFLLGLDPNGLQKLPADDTSKRHFVWAGNHLRRT